MKNIFLQVLNMSLVSSYIILIVLLVRLIIKKMPKILSYSIWIIVFIKLIIPISFESVFSIIRVNRGTIPLDIGVHRYPNINSGLEILDRSINNLLPAAKIYDSINPMQILIIIGSTIWIVGIIFLLIYTIYNIYKLYNNLKTANCLKDNIYITDYYNTGFVFGLINPKIYLPKNASNRELNYILEHEKIHLKRKDYIIKTIVYLITIVHWFNPLVWISFYLMSRDMELSCDERVIKNLGENHIKDYSKALLSLNVNRKISNYKPLSFGRDNIKVRIKNILNYKKPSSWTIIISLLLIVFLSLGLLTNPKNSNNFKIELSKNDILKNIDMNPKEIYEDDKIKLEYSFNIKDENWQIIMSQPVKKGKDGIWMVERVSNDGLSYIQIPDSENKRENYNNLQNGFDRGENELGNPESVLFDYINENFN